MPAARARINECEGEESANERMSEKAGNRRCQGRDRGISEWKKGWCGSALVLSPLTDSWWGESAPADGGERGSLAIREIRGIRCIRGSDTHAAIAPTRRRSCASR